MKRIFIMLLVIGLIITISAIQFVPTLGAKEQMKTLQDELVAPLQTTSTNDILQQLPNSEPTAAAETRVATLNPTLDASSQEIIAEQSTILEPAPVSTQVKATTSDSNEVKVTASPPNTVEVAALSIQILSVTSPVHPGESAILRAHTSAGANCTISVYYTSTRSAAEGLTQKTAESSGNVSWTWKVGTDRTPGSYRIEVVAKLGEKSVSQTIYFDVG